MSPGDDVRSSPGGSGTLPFLLVSLLVAVLLAGVVSHYASSDPDGLTKVSEDQGFAASASDHELDESPFAGYSTSGLESPRLSGGVAGVAGVVTTFLLAGAVSFLVRRRDGSSAATARSAGSAGSAGSGGSGGQRRDAST